MEKNLIVIDAHSLLYRAFHALPPLTNNGRPTGAVYGFLLTLFRAIKDVQATHIVACFDTPAATFRHEAFKEYKAHRAAMPEGIAAQIPMMKEVLKVLTIPVFEKDGFEADDCVATIAEKGQTEANVFIVSGDLDNLQLVNEKVKLYTLGKGIKDSVLYDEAKVKERFGVTPSQMNDFKALTGDVSDNVPGVKGIGKKTAAELIQTYGSIEHLYEEISTDTAPLKPKVKEALKENKENAFLSRTLVEVKRDVDINFQLDDARFGVFDQEKVKDVFQGLGFNSLIERLPALVV